MIGNIAVYHENNVKTPVWMKSALNELLGMVLQMQIIL